MPKFGVRVPHKLTPQEVRARLERFVEVLQQKFENQVSDLEQSWEGDTLRFRFKTYGIPLEGGIAVTEEDLNMSGDLPFSAMMFRGKIESAIREQLERLVAS
ncbi:MAG: polyhydroxyalkanoic acid system family protein [Pirellulales bacterium]